MELKILFDKDPSHTIPLSRAIKFWIEKLNNINSPSMLDRFEGFCEGSWPIFTTNAIIALLAIMRGIEIWFTISFADATKQFCMLNGMASCFVGQWAYMKKRKPLSAAFRKLLNVAETLEKDADEEVKVYSTRVARRAYGWYIFETTHTMVSMCGVLAPPVFFGTIQLELWGLEPQSQLQLWGLIGLQFLICPFAYSAYKFFSLVLNSNMYLAALYTAMGTKLRSAGGCHQRIAIAKLHSELDSAAAVVDSEFILCTTVFCVPVLIGGGLATYNVLSGQMDFYCLTAGQLILFIFIPICQTGQALEDASSSRLTFKAYSGSWLEEDREAQKLCLITMIRASKPVGVSAKMIGSLNLPACQASLKIWFRYTQLLFNTR